MLYLGDGPTCLKNMHPTRRSISGPILIRLHQGCVFGSFSNKVSRRMVKYWSNTGRPMSKYWSNTDQILIKYWPNIDQILTKYWSNKVQILIKYWPNIDKYWPNIYRIPNTDLVPPLPQKKGSPLDFCLLRPMFSAELVKIWVLDAWLVRNLLKNVC